MKVTDFDILILMSALVGIFTALFASERFKGGVFTRGGRSGRINPSLAYVSIIDMRSDLGDIARKGGAPEVARNINKWLSSDNLLADRIRPILITLAESPELNIRTAVGLARKSPRKYPNLLSLAKDLPPRRR